MIDAHRIVTKLLNRVWTDKKIPDLLEKLVAEFDANYADFTSFEKWKK